MRTLFILLSLLLAAPAVAGEKNAAETSLSNSCRRYQLCNLQTATGACTESPAAGREIVARPQGMYAMLLSGTPSVSTTAWSCHLYGSSDETGYDATKRQQITSTALSTSQFLIGIDGIFEAIWIECTGTLTNGVTINATLCPLASR